MIGRAECQSPKPSAEGKRAKLDQSLYPGQDALWAFVIFDKIWSARGRVKLTGFMPSLLPDLTMIPTVTKANERKQLRSPQCPHPPQLLWYQQGTASPIPGESSPVPRRCTFALQSAHMLLSNCSSDCSFSGEIFKANNKFFRSHIIFFFSLQSL